MTVIEVNFLTGRYCATSHHDRAEPEWPPHGARLFSAMVAAWADAELPDEAERAALEWLEALPPPRITAPEAVGRRVVSHFVPVNDASVIALGQYQRRANALRELTAQWEDQVDASKGKVTKRIERLQDKINKARDVESLAGKVASTNEASALALLPDGRVKKERHFPSVTLVEPHVTGSSDDQVTMLPRVGLVPPVTFCLGRHCTTRSSQSSRRTPEAASPGSGTRPHWCLASCAMKSRWRRIRPAEAR